MPFDPKLSVSDHAALVATLGQSHGIRVTHNVLDLNGRTLSSIGNEVRGGAVQCTLPETDSPGSVTRALTLEFHDPRGTMSFDSGSPSDGALYADRMIQTLYGISVPGVGWVDVPIFVGPIIKFSRTSTFVTVECQGKEALARGAAWNAKTWKKNTRKTTIIREVMEAAGETRFDLPDLPDRISAHKSLGHADSRWEFATSMAESMDRQLYYSPDGILRMRPWPTVSSFTYRDGNDGLVQSQPVVDFDIEETKNAVRVTGAKPKGSKHAVIGVAVAPASHPLSPDKLAPTSGGGLYLLDEVSNGKIRTKREADRVAETRLAQMLQQMVTVNFDSLMNPLAELGDWATLQTSDFTMTFRQRAFTLPVTSHDLMSVGTTRRFAVRGRK